MSCVLLSNWNHLRHNSGVYSDPCIQSQSEELRSFFDHKYLYRKYRKGNFVRKSINKYLVEKRGYPLEKKSGKRCFKKSENFEWQPQALLPGQYSFFPVGHLISFSELRTPPAVSDTMAKSGQICQIGFLEKQDWISSNAQTGRLQHLEMLLIQLPKHWF